MKELLAQWGLGEATINMVLQFGLKALGAILVLWLGFMVGGKVQSFMEKRLVHRMDKSISKFLANAIRWAIVLMAILSCLSLFGVDTTSFAAVIGGASVAIGLAFQGSLSNVAAGIMLLIFRPFKVGDVVMVAGQTGAVEGISLFVTTLDTPDLRRIIIPNGQIFGSVIENITHHPTRRVDVNVGVDYSANIDAARQVLLEAAKSVEGVEGEPVIYLLQLGQSSVDFQVRAMAPTEKYWDVRDAVTRACKMALEDAKIAIPYPHVAVVQRAN